MASGRDMGGNIRLGLAAAVAASALFSAKSVFFKMCYQYGTPPVTLQALRGIFSLPFFIWPLAAGILDRRAGRVPFAPRDVLILAALGFSGFYLASILDMVGLQYVSAGTERMILYVYPTLVILFSALMFRKPIARALYLPLALTYAGIALSYGGEATLGGGRAAYGGLLVFLSAVFYAMFLVWQGRLVHRYGPRFFAAACMTVSFSAVLAQFLLTSPWRELAQPRPVLIMSAFTAVFCNVVPTFLFAYGVKLAGAGPTAVAGTVGPVTTLVLSAFLLGERPGWAQLAGLALVVAGALRLSMGTPAGPQGPGAAEAGGGSRGVTGSDPSAGDRDASLSVPGGASPVRRGAAASGPADPPKKAVSRELADPAAAAAAFLAASGGRSTLSRGSAPSARARSASGRGHNQTLKA